MNSELPTREQCFEILNSLHVPAHIIRHSLVTAKLAVFLAHRLNEKGHNVEAELVERACLLHDMLRICDCKNTDTSRFDQPVTDEDRAKWRTLREQFAGYGHEEAAYEMLKDRYPRLALAVKRHRYAALLDENDKPTSWEQKLVYYADKRVMHDKIVPLQQRLDEAHRRNQSQSHPAERRRLEVVRIDKLIFELEQEIFAEIELDPLEVTEQFIDTYPAVVVDRTRD